MKALKKAESIAGLQIADLAAYPIAAKVLRPTHPQPAFDVLFPKINSIRLELDRLYHRLPLADRQTWVDDYLAVVIGGRR